METTNVSVVLYTVGASKSDEHLVYYNIFAKHGEKTQEKGILIQGMTR